MFKKSLSVLLAVVMLMSVFTSLPFTVNAADTDVAPSGATSGVTGDCTWTLDANGALTISGNGEMGNYYDSYSPWRSYSFNTVVIEDGVTSIGSDAFRGCTGLTSVDIPDSVTIIGWGAFEDCTGLKNIDIPDSVTSIGCYAFYNCTGLTSIIIPGSVNKIGSDAFSVCTGITSIKVDPENIWYDSRGDCNAIIDTSTDELISGCSATVIPDSVTSICFDAFEDCTGLTSITIPDSVTSIGASAFESCTSLRSVTIGNSVASIGYSAFEGCEGLTSIDIPDSVTSIGYKVFYGCTGLTSIDIPDSVTSIGTSAFSGCTGLTSVTIGSSVTSIDDEAFEDCTGLTSITIPDSVTYIDWFAFSGCTSLTDVYYGGSESDWKRIRPDLIKATIHYNSTGPGGSGVHDDPVNPAMYCNGKTISGIDVNFDSSWFFKDSMYYSHEIAQLSSQMILEGYIAGESKLGGKKNLTKALYSLGFDIKADDTDYPYINLNAGRDGMNYFIVSKKISQGSETSNLVYVGCIGSWHEQWNSNFDPEGHDSKSPYTDIDATNHRGFDDAKNFIYARLTDYIDKKDFTKSNTKILLTGHSRGAATANLLAAKLLNENKYVSPTNLFTYTFATPNCTNNKNRTSSKYQGIFNIVFPNDFVTKVLPSSWGYGRYGTTFVLPTKTNSSTYESTLKKQMLAKYTILNQATEGNTTFHDYSNGEATVYDIVNTFSNSVGGLWEYYYRPYVFDGLVPLTPFLFFQSGLCPFVNHTSTWYGNEISALGVMLKPLASTSILYKKLSLFFIVNQKLSPNFSDAHKMETYCAFMLGLSKRDVTRYRTGYKGSVNCPVDVEIIDKSTGEVVGRIVNNVVDEEIAAKENSVVMTVEGDQKEYWLPSDGDYEVRLTGNDNGVMDYTLSEVDPDLGETERKNFYDVPLEDGLTYTCAAEDTDPETTPELADFTLTDEAEDIIEPDEAFRTEDAIEYTVKTETAGSGFAEGVTVTSGDYATVSASAVRSDFIGWYQGDTLLSAEPEYRFRPTENTTLTARFTEMTLLLLGDTDGDDEVTVIDSACLQRKLADILTAAYFEQAADTDGDGEVTLMDATYIQRWLIHSESNDNIGKLMK